MDLYGEASPDLIRMLTRKLGNVSEAREVAQETFEKLLRQEADDVVDFRKLCFAVANNLATDVLRRRIRERNQPQNVEQDDGAAANPERILMAREQLKAVQGSLASLPEKTRRVFLLHRFQDYTYVEVARHIGMSRKSVEYHMRRALTAISAAVE